MKHLFKSFSVLLIFTVLAFHISFAQSPKLRPFGIDKLSITYAVLENNYQGKNASLAKITLANTGRRRLPPNGWKIYFNNKSMVTGEKSDTFTIQKKTGNLFELTPSSNFKGLGVGQSVFLYVLTDLVINKNDVPEGFYLVWDNEPLKGYNIPDVIINRAPLQPVNGKVVSDFAETVYKRNAIINREIDLDLPKVFPTPANYRETGSSFELNGFTQIAADALFQKEAKLLANDLDSILDKPIGINAGATVNAIRLKQKQGLAEEGYEMEMNAQGVTISANTAAGAFYGIQSLKTLIPASSWSKKQSSIEIPAVNISDAPRFGYRGFMMDVARNFQTKEEVLRILDLMSLYKLNTFHFHITEDEGWRLEIDGLPELTNFGAMRGHSLDELNHMPAAYGSGPDTGRLYGSGFYSKNDFIEILRYANDRHIKVITEIETPGHARAAIKAMDYRYRKYISEGNRQEALKYLLRDTLDASEYSTPQWFHDNVMNVALPSVYTFIDKVVTEVNLLYKQAGVPITTIHLGGDEVPAGTWEKSPACAELIKKDSALENVNDLWYYYMGKVSKILKAKGLTLSGWEEIALRKTALDGKKITIPNPDFIGTGMNLYVWNNTDGNEDLAYKLANASYKVVLMCVSNFYFDMINFRTYDEPGYYWGSVTDISKTYEFIPFDYFKNVSTDKWGNPIDKSSFVFKQRLNDYGKQNILGLQGAVWSETIKGADQMEFMLLPRLAALAERSWAKDPEWANQTDTTKMKEMYNTAWSSFVQSVGTRQLPMLENYNGGYNYRIPPAGAMLQDGGVVANTQFPNHFIRYTIDGTEPSDRSPLYNGTITNPGIIKLKVFSLTGKESYTTVIENK